LCDDKCFESFFKAEQGIIQFFWKDTPASMKKFRCFLFFRIHCDFRDIKKLPKIKLLSAFQLAA